MESTPEMHATSGELGSSAKAETGVPRAEPSFETGTRATPQPEAHPPSFSEAFFQHPFLFLMLVLIWVWFFWTFRKQKKKEEERKAELASLKKGDRVLTVGGLYGTVVALNEETMTLKPDEKSNTTLKYSRSALMKILPRTGEETEERTPETSSKEK